MMKNLFNPADVSSLVERINNLDPGTQPLWGKMNVAQMLAHCNVSMETFTGKKTIKRLFIGRIVGTLMKKNILSEKPFGRNSPTDKSYVIKGTPDFEAEKAKAIASLKNIPAAGPSGVTMHPHPFFGHFTPEQWAVFEWKHFDHHLRQFGV
ncbi:MAG TPA: DUF1569 domain-containing protein [Flavobacteriales bacterium]|nr:DUF1569 domain-containing protein [Flavobacteriales bacterium]